MKYLLVAHYDDEVIWFNPDPFDKIVIVFGDRMDKPGFGERRRAAIESHPYKKKIIQLHLIESNYWRDPSAIKDYEENYHELCEWLEDNITDEDAVITHDPAGEYGHADHKLVNRACMNTVDCLVNGQNPVMYRVTRDAYIDNGVWTWYLTDNIC